MVDDGGIIGGNHMRTFLPVFTAVISITSMSAAQDVAYVVRHAEKELTGDDPSITVEGRARAAAWAEMLQNASCVIFWFQPYPEDQP